MRCSMPTQLQSVYHDWCKAVTTLLWCHWKLMDARYEVAARWLDMLREPAPSEEPTAEREAESQSWEEIAHRADERLRKGLLPPLEIYQVQNRGRLDWSQFPEWARPSDPELFEGSHEG